MIVCICRGLNTTKVSDAIAAGARSPAQVHAHHGQKINCGKCCDVVCGMIRDARDQPQPCEPKLVAAE
jgi:bacterioferritin-associated ferredoxin